MIFFRIRYMRWMSNVIYLYLLDNGIHIWFINPDTYELRHLVLSSTTDLPYIRCLFHSDIVLLSSLERAVFRAQSHALLNKLILYLMIFWMNSCQHFKTNLLSKSLLLLLSSGVVFSYILNFIKILYFKLLTYQKYAVKKL